MTRSMTFVQSWRDSHPNSDFSHKEALYRSAIGASYFDDDVTSKNLR